MENGHSADPLKELRNALERESRERQKLWTGEDEVIVMRLGL